MKRNLAFLLLVFVLAACGGASETLSDEPIEVDVSTVAPPTEVSDEPVESTAADSAETDTTTNDDHTGSEGINLDLFFDGALANEATIQDCTLSDGTETTCYEITIAGYPANHEAGPFCPETTSDSAEAGGIWFDGNGVYDVDGEFILSLAELYNDSNWKLYDDDGNVNTTETAEEFDLAARPNVDPSLQNHCVEGRLEWLENGEPIPTTVLIPTTPVMGTNSSTPNGSPGITLNGVVIDGSAPVEAILGAYTIAAFDDCGGHFNPVAGYHMHGARGCSNVGETVDGETPIFGYALDGYAIHSPLAEADLAAANLDNCQGHTTAAHGYHYHAASVAENAILSCFNGLAVEGATGGGRGGDGAPQGGGQGGGNGQGGRPDFGAAAAALNISEDELLAALGGPPPDFEAAAETLGITVEALQRAMGEEPAEAAAPAADDEAVVDSAETTPINNTPSNYLDSYTIADTGFGTEVMVTVDTEAGTRSIISNALPNHETGEFPNPGNPNTISAQDASWTYPIEPTFVGTASFARTPGVAINGVKFEPDTAERANCETGEVHSIEAIQDVTDLGLDFNNAHVQPTGEYHYHGVSELLVELYSSDDDLVHVAFAADGHLIYYSKSGAFQPGYRLGTDAREGTNCTYTPGRSNNTITFGSEKDGSLKSDWNYDASFGQLDECNGITVDGEYIYLITIDYPYVPRCLMGEAAQNGQGGGQGGQGGGQGQAAGEGGGQGGGQGNRPDMAVAAASLGITEEALTSALVGRPPDFEAASEALGIPADEIEAAVEASRNSEND